MTADKTVYICDRKKNENCTKTSCIDNDGPCYSTSQPEYAVLDENGKPVLSTATAFPQWEYVRYDPDYLTWSGTCTACHCKHESNEPVSKLSFCPHCGAKMNGEKKPVLIVSGEDQK